VVIVAGAVALTACDTGDGTTLKDPTTATTLPPPPTDPLPSEPGGEVGSPEGDTLPSVPIGTDGGTLPAGSAAPIPTIPPGAPDGLALFAPWVDGGPIPARHSCDGNNSSPPLAWTAPSTAVELAIAFTDESNLSNGRPYLHWVIAGIEPALGGLAEDEVPLGAVEGINFFGDVDFAGPCPAPGDEHTFRLTIFALNQQSQAADGTPAAELYDLVADLAIASAEVTGTYRR
jgi:Raf kinase inhibitor-like YbhB/YbcL family protein